MATQVIGQPGVISGRQIVPLNIHTGISQRKYAPNFYFLDGNNARDPDNSPTSLLRAGLILGKVTANGLYANSVIGLTTAALGDAQTTLSITPQAAVELNRRVGASGNLTLTGEPSAGAAARSFNVAYSAINTTTGAVTITATGTGAVSGTNQVNSIPFVDSTGSGTFIITVEGVSTAAITYSSTVATLVTNINNALNAAIGASAIVASGASLAAVILTASGTGYSARPVGAITATELAGSTGYTINGSGAVGTPSTCAVTTAGVVAVTGTGGEFVSGSLIGTTDGSQNPLTIYDMEFGTDVVFADGTNINQPLQRFLIAADCYSANVINLTACSAGSQAWLKSQLRTNGGQFTFDNDR